ncbi:MAG: AAA family ATPase [Chitinispirillaceae bacterium]|nr:AAA family ATPase [Chitinispirillaceae bacterium]
MPLTIDNTAVPARGVGACLGALRRLGAFELRQAAFFAGRLPDEQCREDFHTLLLLLLACLRRGYPRAGREDLAACLCNAGEPAGLQKQEGVDVPAPLIAAVQKPGNIVDAVAGWFFAISGEETLRRMRPLLGVHPLSEGVTQPLVVYDREHRTFGFHAYHVSEQVLAAAIPAFIGTPAPPLDLQKATAAIGNSLGVSFAGRTVHLRQVAAAMLALAERFVIVAGGPGTGKSAIVHCIVRAIAEYDGIPVDAMVLCAPTGRAKARLLEAVTRDLNAGDPFSGISAKTVHALLGIGSGGGRRFTDERRLPYRLVVVDEVSMVDLRLFANLIEALAPGCRLVLVGDMNQLPPIDAGAVMGDMTAALSENAGKASLSPERFAQVEMAAAAIGSIGGMDELPALRTAATGGMVDHAVFLTRNFRSDKGITDWWEARRAAEKKTSGGEDASSAVELIGASFFTGTTDKEAALMHRYELWMDDWCRNVYHPWSFGLRELLLHESCRDNPEIARKLRALIERKQILCCVHDGPFGRLRANDICNRIFWSKKGKTGRPQAWHDGQPVIVNRNQTGTVELYNGDLGIVLEKEAAFYGCFPVRGGILITPVERITDIDRAYAVSVHKSQGSEFDAVMLVVPDVSGMPITRPLVYTGITRAKRSVCIIDPGDRLADINALPAGERPGLLREMV